MYDRGIPAAQQAARSFGRISQLMGIAGARMSKFRPSWKELVLIQLRLFVRPHLFSVALYEVNNASNFDETTSHPQNRQLCMALQSA